MTTDDADSKRPNSADDVELALLRAHKLHRWGRRSALALYLSIVIVLAVAFLTGDRDDPTAAILRTVFSAVLGLALLALMYKIISRLVRQRVSSLMRQSGLDSMALYERGAAVPRIARDRTFLEAIARRASLYRAAQDRMGKPETELIWLIAAWGQVTDTADQTPKNEGSAVLGIAYLWQAVAYLVVAEQTRIVSHVAASRVGFSFGDGCPDRLTWRAAAKRAIDHAARAREALGEVVGPLTSEIVSRATKSRDTSEEQAKTGPLYRVIPRYGSKVLVGEDWAAQHSGITAVKLIEFAHSLPDSEVLFRGSRGCAERRSACPAGADPA
jgi:hypothetical protein